MKSVFLIFLCLGPTKQIRIPGAFTSCTTARKEAIDGKVAEGRQVGMFGGIRRLG